MQDIPLASIHRGGQRESLHLGAFAVADANGHIVAQGGDTATPIYPRSAIKGLQAIPFLTSGAAARFGFGDAHLALALASHTGEPQHTDLAAAMLARAGRDATCLECGVHWPTSSRAARALAAAGQTPSALHNNCSGKHAGFICTAIAGGRDTAGYVAPDHPVMQAVTAAVSRITGCDLAAQSQAVDGCSIPAFRLPLAALATGFARFGCGDGLNEQDRAAATRLRAAAAAQPAMIAGPGRFDTEVMAALGPAAFVKLGAEGVYCAALPGQGLGLAIKCRDGAARAAEAACAALLTRYLGPHPVLSRYTDQTLTNWQGVTVGALRAADLPA